MYTSTLTHGLDLYSPRRRVGIALLYLALYLVCHWLTEVRPLYTLAVTPWKPQVGLTVALLIVYGWRWLPIAALADFLGAALFYPAAPAWPLLVVGSVWTATAYAALSAALERFRLTGPIETSIAAAQLATLLVLATFLVAAGYIGLFVATDVLPSADALPAMARYWIADLNGVLVVTLLLVHRPRRQESIRDLRGRGREIAMQFGTVVLVLWAVLHLPTAEQLRFFYLLFVPLIWIALRWTWPAALFAMLILQLGLLAAAQTRIHTARFIDLQFLMLTLNLTGLLLGAAVLERIRALNTMRRRDAALAHAMRFAVAGELTSALAHELNQPITALVSYLRASEILAAVPNDDPRLRDTLSKAAQEAIRASAVLRRLRDFYQSGAIKHERVLLPSLCDAIRDTFVERLRQEQITLDIAIDPVVPPLEGDAMQIEIVLHNLIANAIDALEDSRGSPRRILLHVDVVASSVQIRVEDSGPGVPANIAQTLFEPFVTSKSGGMGLGLSISRTLTHACGGELSVARGETLGGAAFIVRLPMSMPQGFQQAP